MSSSGDHHAPDDSHLSSSSSNDHTVIPMDVIPTAHHSAGTDSGATEATSPPDTPASVDRIVIDDVAASPPSPHSPVPFSHHDSCPRSDVSDSDQDQGHPCLVCSPFKWVDPGRGNIVRGPVPYTPVHLTAPNDEEKSMPKLVLPLPIANLGPSPLPGPTPVPPPETCISKISTDVRSMDEEIVKKSKEEVDTLLVVAGLFSAVQGAFIIESYKQLQSDPADVTVQLLLHISQQLANSSLPAASEPSAFIPSSSSVRVNTLWFAGLVISLLTASFGIFSKQWLREYQVNEHTPDIHLHLRFFRAEGAKKWHLFELIAILPLLLQLSMLLFFIGLTEFLSPFDPHVDSVVTILIILWVFFVIAMTLSPLADPQCPWRTPLLHEPFRRLRSYMVLYQKAFAGWRKNGIKLSPLRNPREWLRFLMTLPGIIGGGLSKVQLPLRLIFRSIRRVSVRLADPENVSFPTEEEDLIKLADRSVLIQSYELARNDEFLQSILGSLMSGEVELSEVITCLKDIHLIRRKYHFETEEQIAENWVFGHPVLYSPSLLQRLLPLLIDKLRTRVTFSALRDGDVKAALRFILFAENEAIVECSTIWPLIGGMLQDHFFTGVTLWTLVEHWHPFREIPQYPQFRIKSDTRVLIRNVLESVQNLLALFVKEPSKFTAPSPILTSDTQEPPNKQYLPAVLLDIMFSTFFHADITDLEEQIGLLTQTLSGFTPAIRLMNNMTGNVAVSCDLSIRRLNYLCQKLPSLIDASSALIEELESQLVQHYFRSIKYPKDAPEWQRFLGISPCWRRLLEQEGVLVTSMDQVWGNEHNVAPSSR